jgi:ribonucleoside-diphosphate reductase alpha chain
MGKVAVNKEAVNKEEKVILFQGAPRTDQEIIASFDEHAVAIAKRQYFMPEDKDLLGMFRRVANWVASPEHGEHKRIYAQAFYDLMTSKRFCPGGRVLAGAGTQHGNVLNCFVQDGSPQKAGTNEWVTTLATKLALVTKVGGGNGLCLDPLSPKRPYTKGAGQLYMTIATNHADYEKVKTGTYMDLVHGKYVTKGYRYSSFIEQSDVPASLPKLTVGDSVEKIWSGGSDMIMRLLKGEDVLLDLSSLRPEGTPVNGSGGNSSGPSSFAVEVFDNFAYWASLGGADYAGPVATLRYVFAPTLRVIRQGGTRRGAGMATMSITHPDIQDFITSKDLEREQSEGDISTFNISVLVTDGFMAQATKQGKQGVLWDIADHAWQTGEPGLIYIDRINEQNAMRETLGDIKSTNPCVTADTWVQTHVGARQVKDLVDQKFCATVDGKVYGLESDGFWSTGVKPVFKVKTKRGFELRLTSNHKLKQVTNSKKGEISYAWTELENLTVGDTIALQNHRSVTPWQGQGNYIEGWLLGTLVGDGTFAMDKAEPMACLDFWHDHHEALSELAVDGIKRVAPDGKVWVTKSERKVRVASSEVAKLAARFGIVHKNKTVTDEVEQASYDFYCGFLSGLFDADGSVQGTQENGVSVRLAQSNLELLQRVQRMLARLGIIATLHANRRPAMYRTLPDGKGGSREYYCQADHELVFSNDNLVAWQRHMRFENATKQDRLVSLLEEYQNKPRAEKFSDKITSIELDGEEEVFDVTVEHVHAFDANGISAHNCGEIPLYAGEPCDLGAINLAAYVQTPNIGMKGFDVEGFSADVRTCIRFLDNVLEVNKFALEDNRQMSLKLRRLGLGVMGLADALIMMGYRYDDERGRQAVAQMIGELRDNATEASEQLAKERGAFPGIKDSTVKTERRNVAVLTVAPTGTTSMLMGVSSGVEPVFAPFVFRKIGDSYASLIHPLFQELLERSAPHKDYTKDGKWDLEKVVQAVQDNHGSVQGLDFIPDDVKAVLICAHDISPEAHVRMQGVVQSSFDAGGKQLANSISKTINMPNEATVEDVFRAYSLAFETGCKGITVYRDGSRQFQVLSTKAEKKEDQKSFKDDTTTSQAPVIVTPPVKPATTNTALPNALTASRAEYLPGEPLFERPSRLTGFTDVVKLMLPTGEKRGFYVTVNSQDGLPTEVFIVSGKAGDEANADSEALGRMVSIALQYGVPAEVVVKTLRGINGGMYGTYQGRMAASKADLIAIALETAGVQNVEKTKGGKSCPECDGKHLRYEEGCVKCDVCGYSKCG